MPKPGAPAPTPGANAADGGGDVRRRHQRKGSQIVETPTQSESETHDDESSLATSGTASLADESDERLAAGHCARCDHKSKSLRVVTTAEGAALALCRRCQAELSASTSQDATPTRGRSPSSSLTSAESREFAPIDVNPVLDSIFAAAASSPPPAAAGAKQTGAAKRASGSLEAEAATTTTRAPAHHRRHSGDGVPDAHAPPSGAAFVGAGPRHSLPAAALPPPRGTDPFDLCDRAQSQFFSTAVEIAPPPPPSAEPPTVAATQRHSARASSTTGGALRACVCCAARV